MTRRLAKLLLLSVAISAITSVAHARDGVYLRGDLGYSWQGEYDVQDDGIFDWGDVDLEEGWLASVGAGYAWPYGLRLEGELSYRDNDLESGDILAEGETAVWALMGNAYYDFNKGGRIEPYVGVGIGIASVDVSASAQPPFIASFDDSDEVFAWQGIAGVNFAVNEQWSVDVAYRYFDAEASEFNADQGGILGITREGDYMSQAVTIGARYSLTPPPPPPPPPAPPPPPRPAPPPPAAACPTSEFVVYFEWDRSNLNQAATETIDAAINRARQCNISAAVVVGHTDTSGSPTYNQGLSERRASVVRDALVARGMSASLVQTQARGETDLAQATRDGVREPLNRRAAVTISFR